MARPIQTSLVPLLILLFALLLTACDGRDRGRTDEDRCEALCSELVGTCAFAAFPSHSSCQSGCMYEDEQGGDIRELESCIEDAACDTFAVVQCQRQHGWE